MAESVLEAAARHRKALARGQTEAAETTARAYSQAWSSIQADMRRLQERMDAARQAARDLAVQEARAAGRPAALIREAGDLAAKTAVTPAWLERQERYRTLLFQVEGQLTRIAPLVASTTDTLVQTALAQAAAHAVEILELVEVPFNRVNTAAVTQITGALERGALADLITAKTPKVVADVKGTLRTAVIRGWNPYKTASELRKVAVDLPLSDARRLARTEQMRAYREATRQSFIENDAVKSWIWSCRKSSRSCAYCWAMHGTKHQVREVMATHPNCACTQLPYVEGIDYGETGVQAFRKLPADQQKAILGPAAFQAYQDKQLDITDLVHQSRSAEWGATGRVGSLSAALGTEKAAAYTKAVTAPAPKVAPPAPAPKPLATEVNKWFTNNQLIENAEKMYGKGSKQHKEAIRRFT